MKAFFVLSALIFVMTVTAVSSFSADSIDLSKSFAVGSGSNSIIEFTDPDCPFCRKASKYFDSRPDTTRHVFFYPLPRHPKAKEKAQYILSSMDRAKAYREVMSGTMDSQVSFVTTAKGVKLQQEQLEIAKKMNIVSTPTFIINGRIIIGFDLKKIDEALGPKP